MAPTRPETLPDITIRTGCTRVHRSLVIETTAALLKHGSALSFMQKQEMLYLNWLGDLLIDHFEEDLDTVTDYVAASYPDGDGPISGMRVDKPYSAHKAAAQAKIGGVARYCEERMEQPRPTPTP